MLTSPIAAVMVHVPDVAQALSWYAQVLPNAQRRTIGSETVTGFEYLDCGGVMLECVPADQKVTAGTAGTVVYWQVPDFGSALEHALKLGGTLYRGPMDIEDQQRMCQVRDPWGNLLGLRGPTEAQDAAQR